MVRSLTYEDVLYPDSDGLPMAENTLQYKWIVRLASNLKYLLKDQIAFVAGDLLWYPVKVNVPPVPCQAPDVFVALGRPDGDRRSYKQWEEDNVAPQVVFEILSSSNSAKEMTAKQAFYEKHGVLELYIYNPESYEFWGLVRHSPDQEMVSIFPLKLPWISPLLGIRFELFEDGLSVFHPDGELFKEPGEFINERDQLQKERDQIRGERDQVQEERDQIQDERDRLAAKLREMGIDPNQL
ncbi:MAG: Uma2 family endonuclease [Merismopedia sp. SIO2A8]|nr:Uma2 family endonuclease [Symploca sp. SIO2B6]NET50059.1 Uma2 family endonuclease [Merismopedia sp. SIO2A8]